MRSMFESSDGWETFGETKNLFADNGHAAEIFGYQDKYLRLIENALKVHLLARGDELTVSR